MVSAKQSLSKLISYCEKEEFKGYDPYDGLNSKLFQSLPVLPGKRFPRLVWIQLFKKLPFNFRAIAGVKKDYNAKGLGLFLTGYVNLAKIEGISRHIDHINFFAEKLIELRSPGYSGACWGYNFPWEAKAFYQPRFTPTVVASTFVANALIDAYELTGNEKYLQVGLSTKDFVLKDLNRTVNEKGNLVFSYSPMDRTSVFNASLLGARLLARAYYYTKDQELFDTARKAVAYCSEYQNADGSWYYSTLPFHQWIDNFHTGFNLECMIDYRKYTGDQSFNDYIDKGMKYYLETFFDKEGRSAYYSNSLFPIDIHAPSQLFVTLYKAGIFSKNKELAQRVLNWTVNNMQSPKGYFYYQKRKYYTNKISYMRWSQAWIFYGLTYYLLGENPSVESSMRPHEVQEKTNINI